MEEKPELTFKEAGYSEAELQDVCQLMQTCFPGFEHQFTLNYMCWLYKDNPVGEVIGFNAFDQQGLLVGHYATIPIMAEIDNEKQIGLLSLNTATHPSARGKGLFTRLAVMTYELARSKGYGFVMGVANQNSTHGFSRKLGFQLVSPLDVKVGIGFPPLSSTNNHGTARFKLLRDENSIRWRLARPNAKYKISRKQKIVFSPTHVPLVDVALGKLNIDYNDRKNFSLKKLPLFPTMWIGLDASISWKKSLYMDLPERLKPSPLNFIFLDLSDQKRELRKEDIEFDALGFDAY